MHPIARLPLLAALLALAACGRNSADAEPPIDVPRAAATASDFSVHDLEARWVDQDGRERTLASLGGKARVISMVYTSCTHTCPMIVAEMKRVEAALPAEERGRVAFVLVSLDTARDTPAQLAKFASAMRLDPASWTLLTGGAGGLRELAALLGIRYRPEADAQISHSNTYLVLDPAGRIVHRQDGIGRGTDATLARIRESAAGR
ncbi:MAG TPA: SCO family protein [Longimicrobium sp.]|nr:SCO family protein [Longimicrobium sp.]